MIRLESASACRIFGSSHTQDLRDDLRQEWRVIQHILIRPVSPRPPYNFHCTNDKKTKKNSRSAFYSIPLLHRHKRQESTLYKLTKTSKNERREYNPVLELDSQCRMHTCQHHKEDNKGNTNPAGWGIPVWREVEIIAVRHDLFKGSRVCVRGRSCYCYKV